MRTVTGRVRQVSNDTNGRNLYFRSGPEGGELGGQFIDVRRERTEIDFFQTRPDGPRIPEYRVIPNPYFDVQVSNISDAASTGQSVTLIREDGLFDSNVRQPVVGDRTLVLVHD